MHLSALLASAAPPTCLICVRSLRRNPFCDAICCHCKNSTVIFAILVYSELYPVGEYFFHLHVKDSSKTYVPESQSLFDIPTAVAFFGDDPVGTTKLVSGLVQRLLAEWNAEFADGEKVSKDRCNSFVGSPGYTQTSLSLYPELTTIKELERFCSRIGRNARPAISTRSCPSFKRKRRFPPAPGPRRRRKSTSRLSSCSL